MNSLINLSTLLEEKEFTLLNNIVSNATEDGKLLIKDFLENKIGMCIPEDVSSLSQEQLHAFQIITINYESKLRKLAIYEKESFIKKTVSKLSGKDSENKGWLANNFIYIFSVYISTFVFYYIHRITFDAASIPETGIRFVDITLGNMYNLIATIVGFFFGNAWRGAKEKIKTYEEVLDKTKGL